MRRREYVEPIWTDERRRMGARASHGLNACAGARVDGLDQPWLADGNMDDASRRIEERDVGSSGKRPRIAGLTRISTHLHQRRVITGDIKATALVIDIEPVRTAGGKRPVL